MEALGTLKVALTPFLDNIFGHFEKIIVIGAKTTFVNLPALDVQIQPIADGVGMQLPLIKVNLIALNYFKTSYLMSMIALVHSVSLSCLSYGSYFTCFA